MKLEIYLPMLLLGLSNIFSWILNYYDKHQNNKLQKQIDELKLLSNNNIQEIQNLKKNHEQNKLSTQQDLFEIRQNIDKSNEQIRIVRSSCNLFTNNFESSMKTKTNNIITNWFENNLTNR